MRDDLEWRRSSIIGIRKIKEIEDRLEIKLPDDFKNIIENHSGGCPLPHTYDYPTRAEAVLHNLLDFDMEEDDNVVEIYNDIKDDVIENVYPFAEDPFGNLICFDYRESQTNPKIVFWDHELLKDDPDNFQHICDSFTELLDKLYET